jgi:hypothetical protein
VTVTVSAHQRFCNSDTTEETNYYKFPFPFITVDGIYTDHISKHFNCLQGMRENGPNDRFQGAILNDGDHYKNTIRHPLHGSTRNTDSCTIKKNLGFCFNWYKNSINYFPLVMLPASKLLLFSW